MPAPVIFRVGDRYPRGPWRLPASATCNRVLVRRLLACGLLMAVLVVSCGDQPEVVDPWAALDEWSPSASLAPDPDVVDGLTRVAYQDGDDRLVLRTRSGEVDFLTGVNVGATVPGHAPGELAVDRATWARWFDLIARTGVHAIRVYTILPPHFYEELLAFNQANPDRPLYLVHGVWIPEEHFLETQDLWDPALVARMEADVRDAVAVVHGDATLPERPGFAAGDYTADVSPWVLSWALGVELDPYATRTSDRANAGLAAHAGTYVRSTDDATPTETWLARMLDVVATEEAARGRTMPLTFTNWPTTDPLEHPSEPLESEDLVGIDAEHVVTTDAWPGGRYASMHAYPYYPDFQRYEYDGFELDGAVDNYAGYLTALREHYASQPLVVLETGVPSSIGSAHLGPLGRDQGGHTEAEAMAHMRDLVGVVDDVDLAGAFLFAWADEWFKPTWNTAALERPADRRPMWQNALTNEAYFGLLAVEPGADGRIVTIDGSGDAFTPDVTQSIFEGDGEVAGVRAIHDAERLFLHVRVRGTPWETSEGLTVAFDAVAGGGGALPGTTTAVDDADVVLRVAEAEARVWIRASLDPNTHLYGPEVGSLDAAPDDLDAGSGAWEPVRQLVNHPLTIPTTGETRPAEWHEINPLVRGTTDPSSPDFDAHATWAADEGILELALPWGLLGFADPSSRRFLVPADGGGFDTETVERLGITLVVGDGPRTDTNGYAWEPWQSVTWHERPKHGLATLVADLRSRATPHG